jgi:hypothetical protein
VCQTIQNTAGDAPPRIWLEGRASAGIEAVNGFKQSGARQLRQVGKFDVAASAIQKMFPGDPTGEIEVKIEQRLTRFCRPRRPVRSPQIGLTRSRAGQHIAVRLYVI